MKNKTLIYYFICILLICLLKYSYQDEFVDNFDIDYVMTIEAVRSIFYKLNITEILNFKLTDIGKKVAIKFIKRRIKKGIEDMSKVPKVPCDSRNQFIHAKESAIINNKRDPNNKGLSREIIYMYLSHYVDIPPEFIGETCDANDEEPYYANWITNDDRDTYESFIRVINGVKEVEDFMNVLDLAKSAKDKLVDYQTEMVEKGFFPFVNNKFEEFLEDFATSEISGGNVSEYFKEKFGEKFEEISELFNYIDEDTPEDEVISKIQERLGKNFLDSGLLESVTDAFTAALEFSIGSVNPITAAFTMAKVPLIFINTLAPKAAVLAMLNSVSGRAAERFMRSIGGR